MENVFDFLLRKGINKVYQQNKRYNLTIGEIVEFLEEYSTRAVNDFVKTGKHENSAPDVIRIKR
ncbi:MAG: hypothetical protein KFF73_14650 [Cyclobacteriaceae bacterium]|nr:hypothetical protein [Cyclobacteriaceae bacterium]